MASERPEEKEAIRTTIVGGRPPGCGKDVGSIPRGIEVLVKKASIDAEFKAALLDTRAEAASLIDLDLDAAEAAMLGAIPRDHLERIIDNTVVTENTRRAFMGRAAAVMLAALTAGSVIGCDEITPTKGVRVECPPTKVEPTDGIRPDRPEPTERPDTKTRGIRPDRPGTLGIQPDRPPDTKGLRPDRPKSE